MRKFIEEIKQEISKKMGELEKLERVLVLLEGDSETIGTAIVKPRQRKHKRWTNEEWKTAKRMQSEGATHSDIARKVGRTNKSVLSRFGREGLKNWSSKSMLNTLKVSKRRKNKTWTGEEDTKLRLDLMQGKSYKSIARELKRTLASVRTRASLKRYLRE